MTNKLINKLGIGALTLALAGGLNKDVKALKKKSKEATNRLVEECFYPKYKNYHSDIENQILINAGLKYKINYNEVKK